MSERESKSAATIRRKRHKIVSIPNGYNIGAILRTHKPGDPFDSQEEDVEPPIETHIAGPPVISKLLANEWKLFLGLVAFRFVNALIVQTSYVPDEYWQSVEVAHSVAFGYGYYTWEWREGLRSATYPLIFAMQYRFLRILRLDYRHLVVVLPRVTQGFFAAVGDIYLYKLSRKVSGPAVARWSLLCQLTSWFTFYCCTRTLTNSMETVLTTVGLYYYPWPGRPRKAHWKYLSALGLAVVVRPTAAVLWAPLCLWHLIYYRHFAWRVVKLFAERAFMTLSLSSIVDRLFYGKWVNVHYNFLQFNVLSNMASIYGTHPWHWYLSQGFAVVMGTHLFPFLLALRNGLEKPVVGIIGWTVFVYSWLDHKEFRFLFPVVPLVMHVCGAYIHSVTSSGHSPPPSPTRREERHPLQPSLNRGQAVVLFLVMTNLPLAMYTSVLHQRGTVDVMRYLAEAAQRPAADMRVLFLMPCHSTPWYSHVHQNIPMRFLTCEPNLRQAGNYTDEADVFYSNPTKWLRETFPSSAAPSQLPTHVVMFDRLQYQVLDFLSARRFRRCATFFHTHVPEGRVGSHVVVACTGPDGRADPRATYYHSAGDSAWRASSVNLTARGM